MKQLQRYTKKLNLSIGLLVIVGFLLVMLVSFFYTPHDVNAMNIPEKLRGPDGAYLFGTDEFGRDIFSRIMKGTQTAFAVGLLTVGIGTLFGITIGGIAGYVGGWVDELFMRTMDALMAFPGIILALMLVAVFGPGIVNTAVALGIIAIPAIARIARSGFVQQRDSEYVLAAKLIGVKPHSIMFRHILPNISSQIIVAATVTFATAMLAEAALSYLGLGVQPPNPSWGRMLKDSQAYLIGAPWYTYAPGGAITILVLGLYMLSNALRDFMDPRSKS
ncbi:ABC transporter permease [Lysinibacillus sp. RSDA_15]|uniref:ABC transporter permease n=1 Tax=Lysinibacillus TaxID=400634 RepID=UPI000567BD3B|nr:ABC transporter permease [Lysinibacillus sphaericus]PIJ97130.1 ABC transporter permease [Lysinibacillus sphaericus]QTB24026.1 ABC transporter permease [Lysinibacillus sphaericus]